MVVFRSFGGGMCVDNFLPYGFRWGEGDYLEQIERMVSCSAKVGGDDAGRS